MKDLLSKEHYYYKIDTSLIENSTTVLPSSIDNPPPFIWITPAPHHHFYQKILVRGEGLSMMLKKIPTSYK